MWIEGGSDFGALAVVKHDERDVVFFTGGGEHGGWENKGNCEVCPPSAVRFRLETVCYGHNLLSAAGRHAHPRRFPEDINPCRRLSDVYNA